MVVEYLRCLQAKLCQILMFLVGDVDGQLHLTARVQAAQPDAPYVNGMLAYALAETGQLEQAEEVCRVIVFVRAVAINSLGQAGRKGNSIVPDPWSQHAVAHAMDRMGRFDEGIEYMEANSPSWDGCNSFMYRTFFCSNNSSASLLHSSCSSVALALTRPLCTAASALTPPSLLSDLPTERFVTGIATTGGTLLCFTWTRATIRSVCDIQLPS